MADHTVDYDNSQACSMPRGSILSFLNPDRFVILLIDIPVLLVDGEYDALWVDIDLEAKAALFKNASVTTYLQSDAGHTCMLHLTYQSLFHVIDNWMEENFRFQQFCKNNIVTGYFTKRSFKRTSGNDTGLL